MIDKLKKTWYTVKKRVKERLPCLKRKKSVLQLASLSLSVLLFGQSLNLLTSSAESIVSQDLTDYLDTFMDSVEVGEAFQAMGIDGKKAAAVYFATVTMLNEVHSNPIIVSDGSPDYKVVSGFYKKNNDSNIYFGSLYPCTTNGGTLFQGSSGIKYTLSLTADNNILDNIEILNSIVASQYYNSFYYYFSRSNSDGWPFFVHAVPSGDSYFQECVGYNSGYNRSYLMSKYVYSTYIDTISNTPFQQNSAYAQFCLFGCGTWFVPPDNSPDWESIKAMTPDARKTEIDRYIKDVLNVYTLQQNPELEPFLYYPPTPEPTEPTDPIIYDPDNEPNDLFGWLRLIVQAIISLISGIVRPVVNAVNAVFGAISDGFAAVLAFLGGLFTPDISLIQTEIDFIQAKFAFVGQIKLFVNDFMGVLTGYDGSPPDVITVDFDNSNTGFLSNVVGKAVLIDLSWFTPYRLTVHAILSAMLWVFYLWRLFHQLPAVVAGQAAVEHMAEDAAKNP